VSRKSLLGPVERYYSAKLAEHGPVAAGADWNSSESQELRFRELMKVCDRASRFTVNDIGCGYGALVPFLQRGGYDFVYRGFDISAAMVAEAREMLGETERWAFVEDEADLSPADYSVASGVFNVKLDADDGAWKDYVLATLDRLAELSGRGFAFNMLTSYSDPDRKRADLYYADPESVFAHCKEQYSRHVALLHDYGLWEFTVIVRTEPAP
jgi:SAM-dependent methyltransferase